MTRREVLAQSLRTAMLFAGTTALLAGCEEGNNTGTQQSTVSPERQAELDKQAAGSAAAQADQQKKK